MWRPGGQQLRNLGKPLLGQEQSLGVTPSRTVDRDALTAIQFVFFEECLALWSHESRVAQPLSDHYALAVLTQGRGVARSRVVKAALDLLE
jgi:hypothetical protein